MPILKIGSFVESVSIREAFTLKQRTSGKLRLAEVDTPSGTKEIDVSWLMSASDRYKISSDLKDYVIVELPGVTVDIPNRNMDEFSYEELTSWSPMLGRIVYTSFVGKPTFQDHDNKDPSKAKGTNFDTALLKGRSRTGKSVYQVMVLAGYDRTKDRSLVTSILSKKRRGYSMGALVDFTLCSVCGKVSSKGPKCDCMNKLGKGKVKLGKLIYDRCKGVNFIEISSVEDPADWDSYSDSFWE